MYAVPASSTVRRAAPPTTVVFAMSRRSSASACVRVRPSAVDGRRFRPTRRLTRRPRTRHDPYQVSRPVDRRGRRALRSRRSASLQSPAIPRTMSRNAAHRPRPNWNHIGTTSAPHPRTAKAALASGLRSQSASAGSWRELPALVGLDSGGGIRTRDLRVMSPTSYQTAPPRGVGRTIAPVGGRFYSTLPTWPGLCGSLLGPVSRVLRE